jgi:hypothetical protein
MSQIQGSQKNGKTKKAVEISIIIFAAGKAIPGALPAGGSRGSTGRPAHQESDHGIRQDPGIIQQADALLPALFLVRDDDEIRPVAGEFPGLHAVGQVDDQAQEDEDGEEDQRPPPAEEPRETGGRTRQDEDLQDFEPRRLEFVAFDELDVVGDFGKKAFHG